MDQTATDIGSRLHQAREQRGLTLRDIANTTKISTTALNAIEHNDFARLPGGVFRRAYVRAFAAEVGLNADELAREYRAKFEAELPADALPMHDAGYDDRSRTLRRAAAGLAICLGLLICGLLLMGLTRFRQEPSHEDRTLNAVESNPPEAAAPTDELDGIEHVEFVNTAVADTGAASLRLELRLNGPCWVSVLADGERVIYRLMQPGERSLVEARSTITLSVGDAATVAYSINGTAGRPLGGNGEVATVRITSDEAGGLEAEPASAIPYEGTATRIPVSGSVRSAQEGRRQPAVADERTHPWAQVVKRTFKDF
ncbi:MAG: DUF4115 domain-containing protein [Luteitalea sp.]|nr:DUF4115 domain-containing protein [Luteitalea sp.]